MGILGFKTKKLQKCEIAILWAVQFCIFWRSSFVLHFKTVFKTFLRTWIVAVFGLKKSRGMTSPTCHSHKNLSMDFVKILPEVVEYMNNYVLKDLHRYLVCFLSYLEISSGGPYSPQPINSALSVGSLFCLCVLPWMFWNCHKCDNSRIFLGKQ